MWTCWKVMPPLQEVQIRLRLKYNMAMRVVEKNDGETLMPFQKQKSKRKRRQRVKRSVKLRPDTAPSRRAVSHGQGAARVRKVTWRRPRQPLRRKLTYSDLIYFQKSPSFCKYSRKQGSLGTRGRKCEATAVGFGSCKYLCCGRGYRTVAEVQTESCNCQFRFCCEVECDECVSNITSHYCL